VAVHAATWLYRIATNRCLNARRDQARRVPPEPVPPFTPPEPSRRGEVTWLQPFPDVLLAAVPDRAPGPEARYGMREAVELAFVVGLQQFAPRQTAVLILRDVLGYSAEETADLLDTTATAVKGALQRPGPRSVRPAGHPADRRATVAHPAFPPTPYRTRPGSAPRAADRRCVLAMPPAPHEYHGRRRSGNSSSVARGSGRCGWLPVEVNTQPAYACYLDSAPAGVLVLTVRGGRIAGLTRFLDSDMLCRFGLLQPSLPSHSRAVPAGRLAELPVVGRNCRSLRRIRREVATVGRRQPLGEFVSVVPVAGGAAGAAHPLGVGGRRPSALQGLPEQVLDRALVLRSSAAAQRATRRAPPISLRGCSCVPPSPGQWLERAV